MIKKPLLSLLIFLACLQNSHAHAGHKHKGAKISAFSSAMDSKFAINSDTAHLGHFYLRRVKTRKNTEKLFITQTFHFDEDYTAKTKAKYNRSNNLLSYRFTIPARNEKYFFFINLDNLDGTENNGHRIIINTEDGSSSSEEIKMSVVSEDNHN